MSEHATEDNHDNSNRSEWKSPLQWHWPLPDLSSNDLPFLPAQLPRPDKFTFLKAMNYARSKRKPEFAREVWARREAWKAQIQQLAEQDLESNRWTEVTDADVIRHENTLVTGSVNIFWAKTSAYWSEETDNASNTLFEGYIRLLYIETLSERGFLDEAYSVVLEGTGEDIRWTQAILANVKSHAEAYGHVQMYHYIDALDLGLDTIPTPTSLYD